MSTKSIGQHLADTWLIYQPAAGRISIQSQFGECQSSISPVSVDMSAVTQLTLRDQHIGQQD